MSHRIYTIHQNEGAIIEVVVCPLFEGSKYNPEQCIKIVGLLDTGASHSSIDKEVAESIGLIPRDIINVLTPSGCSSVPVYVCGIGLESMGPIGIHQWELSGCDFKEQYIKALIGRDILKNFTMIYNGWNNTFQLHI